MYAATNLKPSDYLPTARETTRYHRSNKYAHQDGREFYDSHTGELVARYPDIVKNDYDQIGAAKARDQFLRDHPIYRISEGV